MKTRKRMMAWTLSLALLFGTFPGAAFAAELGPPCENHPEHDGACGYVEGSPCGHTEHTAECYTDELICEFKDAEQLATVSDAAPPHTHGQECYALDCAHERGEHNDTCGYVEARPCGHKCALCAPQDTANGGEAVVDSSPVPETFGQARASGWVKENDEWYFYEKDGSLATDVWKKSGDKWFYLGSDGCMCIDQLIFDRDETYYVDSTGAMVTRQWMRVSNEGDIAFPPPYDTAENLWFYFDNQGKALRSESFRLFTIGGKRYTFDETGRMLVGFRLNKDGQLYYFDESDPGGEMCQGWRQLNISTPRYPYYNEEGGDEKAWFYFKSNGKAAQGGEGTVSVVRINSKNYAFDDGGRLYSGWVAEDKTPCRGAEGWKTGLYYFGPSAPGSSDNGYSSAYQWKNRWLETANGKFRLDEDGKKVHAAPGSVLKYQLGGNVHYFDEFGQLLENYEETGQSIPVILAAFPDGLGVTGPVDSVSFQAGFAENITVGGSNVSVGVGLYPETVSVTLGSAEGEGEGADVTFYRAGFLQISEGGKPGTYAYSVVKSITIPAYPSTGSEADRSAWMAQWGGGVRIAYVLEPPEPEPKPEPEPEPEPKPETPPSYGKNDDDDDDDGITGGGTISRPVGGTTVPIGDGDGSIEGIVTVTDGTIKSVTAIPKINVNQKFVDSIMRDFSPDPKDFFSGPEALLPGSAKAMAFAGVEIDGKPNQVGKPMSVQIQMTVPADGTWHPYDKDGSLYDWDTQKDSGWYLDDNGLWYFYDKDGSLVNGEGTKQGSTTAPVLSSPVNGVAATARQTFMVAHYNGTEVEELYCAGERFGFSKEGKMLWPNSASGEEDTAAFSLVKVNKDGTTIQNGGTATLTQSTTETTWNIKLNDLHSFSPFVLYRVDYLVADNPFTDVAETDWFYQAVTELYSKGIMQGTSATTFSPQGAVTRAQAAQALYNMDGRPQAAPGGVTSDIPADAWYADAAAWAMARGIVQVPGDRFDGDDPGSRQELVEMLYRYAKYKGWDVSVGEDTNILSYQDFYQIGEAAVAAFQWACGAGIVQGDKNGYLHPQDELTRAELAQMLQRALDKYEQPAAPVSPNTGERKARRYKVQKGDTLSGLAGRFHTTVAALMGANPIIKDPNFLLVGWELDIPQN